MVWSQPKPWANTIVAGPLPASRTLFLRCTVDMVLQKIQKCNNGL
jgi:hypothetical protein